MISGSSGEHTKKNPPRVRAAAALRYDSEENTAPKLLAYGRGVIADQILDAARAHNVPLREDAHLVELLGRLQIGQEIPPELYQIVAEVLAFVYEMDAKYPG